MANWLGDVKQHNLIAAHDELQRMRDVAKSLAGDPCVLNVDFTHRNHRPSSIENSLECGIDFIAAVTDALKPGCYRARSIRH